MAGLEQEKSFGERNGERVRNVSLLFMAVGLVPGLNFLIFPSLVVAGGGEAVRRVSKPKQPQYAG
ncbi:MAG: hypothetical protein ACD_50C00023G0002 [uncultured bacterium]|nr:MAG: hypothetical protein ACD_50C00023G0002 [uncultured bacterium]OGH14170.1 MAG: hypothetical protein A2687_03495 [Candidatus Levybacteria bacterium RIFCSPHIGHO2_01_FULL_38_26]